MAGAYDLNNDATRVILVDASGNVIGGTGQAGNADDQAATDRGLVTNARLYGYDGAAWDRVQTGAGRLQASIMPAVGVSDGGTAGLLADASGGNRVLANAPNLYNGATWDRQRGNTEGTLLASAARTLGATSAVQTNYNARGVMLFLSVSAVAVPGTTLYVRVRAYSPSGGSNGWVLGSTNTIAVVANEWYGLALYPGVTPVANSTFRVNAQVSNALPRTWYADVTPNDANSVTYSLDYCLIV